MKRPPRLRLSVGKIVVFCILIVLLLAMGRPASAQATRIIFLHHSCGQNLIEQGGVRQGLTALGYEFYDHDYNEEGLRLADGSYTGTNFNVPDDNTDPDGFAAIFAQPLHDPPDNTFSHLMQYDVIAFKSCFPVSNIWGDEHLAEYKSYYLSIRDRIDQYPNKLFIIVTQPPQVPNSSDPEEAARARAFANWLQSDEYLSGHPNVVVFDFFGLLAGSDNFLRSDYRVDNYDAHPNNLANSTIGPLFVDFIDQAIRNFKPGEAGPPPAEGGQPEEEQPEGEQPEEEQPAPPAGQPVGGLVEGFETTTEPWEANSDGPASIIECGGDTEFSYEGAASLRVHHEVAPDGWADCGSFYDPPQNWGGSTGLSAWIMADSAGQEVRFLVFAGPADGPSPYQVVFQTTEESVAGWTQFVFPWSEFGAPEWADAATIPDLDPTSVTGIAFNFITDQEAQQGIFWMDNLSLISGEEPPAAPEEEQASEPEGEKPSEAGPEQLSEPEGAPPVEEAASAESEEETGGICPLSAVILPLGALGVALVSRRVAG